jgi:hypothetical protein
VPTVIDLTGLDHVAAGLRRLQSPNVQPLLDSCMLIIEADNRQGIMAGTDKDGVPMRAVTYRPQGPPKRFAKRKVGAFNPGTGGNLSSVEYRRLGGPPLAPRGTASRVITNLHTGSGRESDTRWYVIGYWEDVVSSGGVPFLIAHFEGRTITTKRAVIKLPRRDLRGLRPAGREKARTALRAWARDEVRQAFG